MASENSAESRERKSDGNETLPETGRHDQLLSPMGCQYLELQPLETNVLAAATMAPRAQKFEPGKLLSQVEKIREAEKLRVMECRRSLAWEMELDELESLLLHLGCSEPARGYPLDDAIWQNPIIAPVLHVFQESRRAHDNPVVIDKKQEIRLILEMHEHQCGLTRPEFPCAIDEALHYCSGISSQSISPLKQAFKDLQTHSEWELSNANKRGRSITRNHPLRRKNTSFPLPTSFLQSDWMEKSAENSIRIIGEAELATLLLHFGNFWNLAQSHYLAAHEVKSEADSRRVAALKKTDKTGVTNRERDRWLECAKAFAKKYGKGMQVGRGSSLKSSSIIDDFTIEYRRKKGAPAGDLVKALFQTILGAKDDLDVTPGIIKQRAIESLGKRKSVPFKALTDEAIHEVAEVLLMKTKTKRPTSTQRKRTRRETNKTS